MPLEAADAAVWGDVDASNQPRPDVTLFTSVGLEFELGGVTRNQGEHLVERFKGK
jgi:hypothetical protein